MLKLIAVLGLAALFAVFSPNDAAAADCTGSYTLCIAEAGLLEEPFQSMKDLECGAEYVGCIGRKALFW